MEPIVSTAVWHGVIAFGISVNLPPYSALPSHSGFWERGSKFPGHSWEQYAKQDIRTLFYNKLREEFPWGIPNRVTTQGSKRGELRGWRKGSGWTGCSWHTFKGHCTRSLACWHWRRVVKYCELQEGPHRLCTESWRLRLLGLITPTLMPNFRLDEQVISKVTSSDEKTKQ